MEEFFKRKWLSPSTEKKVTFKIKSKIEHFTESKNKDKNAKSEGQFEDNSNNQMTDKSQLPLSQIDLDSNIFFEDIETEIEQNLVELRTLYQRLQDLNSDLGYTVMQKEFLNAVERLKLDSYFTWVGQEQAARLTGDTTGLLNEQPDIPNMRYNCYYYTSGVFPRKYNQQISRLLFRLTKSNALIQILDFDQTHFNKKVAGSGYAKGENSKNMTYQSPELIWGKPVQDGEDLSIFFINIPRSKLLIRKIFKILNHHQSIFLEIPKSEEIHNEILNLTEKINEYRIVVRRSYFNLDAKIKPYYFPRRIKAADQVRFNGDFSGLGATEKEDIEISRIEEIHLIELRYKMLNSEMNRLNISRVKHFGTFVYEGVLWVPDRHVPGLMDTCRVLNARGSSNKLTKIIDPENLHLTPPTYFETNDLTAPFQKIVDTYGVPRYGEVNPAIFTIVTFPFQFGIMYGDMGHGGLYFLFGILLVLGNERFSKIKALKGLFKLRYLFFGMGFFAFYCGIVYNEFFSIPLKLFASCYSRIFEIPPSALPGSAMMPEFTYQRNSPDCVPTVGVDSVWFASTEEIGFVNSFKMKLSIIVGVTHMVLGLFMKGVNAFNFKKPLDFFFEFIPQLLFMLVTFGYMCLTIIVKWIQNWGDGSGAPSIISIFINVGTATPKNGILWGDDQGIMQTFYQHKLFIIAFICVLLMMIPKPLILTIQILSKSKKSKSFKSKSEVLEFKEEGEDEDEDNNEEAEDSEEENDDLNSKLLNKSSRSKNSQNSDDESNPLFEGLGGENGGHKEHGPGEIWVDQMVEIIEFVLGSISSTASYLRLWALSLAHGQLAKVFLTMTLLPGIKSGNIIATLIGFPVFIMSTFGVLIFMDAMECFLHTLRLHWVEFQNKFYKGDGLAFKPFKLNERVLEDYKRQLLIENSL